MTRFVPNVSGGAQSSARTSFVYEERKGVRATRLYVVLVALAFLALVRSGGRRHACVIAPNAVCLDLTRVRSCS